ncbi:hypothetical protein [Streptomyces sp. WAC00263]|uniref:hypothetical protein n=1 Tax=Streptomyces sp. WAC00263 TaxID=1917422 RepID=UPI0015EF9771|nr:hypothetical protein [Streptomyces sp. WAC00263]KAF5990243.1 hypothetical protein BOG92_054400 [Streptomyces sp. WAC00263]KAF5999186.1 hypothetical protein BOG92_000130 [Streptomyces sp. WAC00263]
MAKSSADGPDKRKKAPTWPELAAETDGKKAQWIRGRNHTEFAPCGIEWDAVSVRPMQLGVDALVAMRIGTRLGYPIVADRLCGVLYVLVPPGSADLFVGIPGVRVLDRGHQLLVPRTAYDSSPAADGVGTPRDVDNLVLVRPDRLAARLRDLAPAYEEAMAS